MNTYEPLKTTVKEAKLLSHDSMLLDLTFDDSVQASNFSFIPGQFVEVSLPGYGEIPVGIASAPSRTDGIDVSVRKVGNVSGAIHRLEAGDKVGVRGPFGNGFTKEMIGGKDLIILSGGCGIPPMRSLVLDIIDNRGDYGEVHFLYGARTQNELLFRKEYAGWEKKVNVLLTTDTEEGTDPGLGMDCATGVVTTLLDKVVLTDDMVAVMCGPPIMYKFVIQKLQQMGMSDDRILVSLERRMKCGIGKCQHCTSGSQYVCMDGPVFTYEKVKSEYGGL